MKEFKGTPGPWEIMDDDGELKIVQSGSIEYGQGWKIYSGICGEVSDQDNAKLIAAAPELLEVLQDLESRARIYVNTSKAKEAINKALGE